MCFSFEAYVLEAQITTHIYTFINNTYTSDKATDNNHMRKQKQSFSSQN